MGVRAGEGAATAGKRGGGGVMITRAWQEEWPK